MDKDVRTQLNDVMSHQLSKIDQIKIGTNESKDAIEDFKMLSEIDRAYEKQEAYERLEKERIKSGNDEKEALNKKHKSERRVDYVRIGTNAVVGLVGVGASALVGICAIHVDSTGEFVSQLGIKLMPRFFKNNV